MAMAARIFNDSLFIRYRVFTIRRPVAAIGGAPLSKRCIIHTCTNHPRIRIAVTWRGVTGPLIGRSSRDIAPNFTIIRRGLAGGKRPDDGTEKNSQPNTTLKTRLLSLAPSHENVYTLPNILTFSRLLSAPLIGYLVLHNQHAWAVGLFAYAGITDLVDGWIARKWKLQTVVGTVIDPMADKTLMTVLTGCLAWQGGMPVWLALIILSRDILLGIAAIYYRYISLPPPKTFSRYWDFSLPSAEVHPTGISKVNTALQLGLIGWTVGMPFMVGWGESLQTGLIGMQYLVATTTIWSGASYLYTKDAVKILTPEERSQRTTRS